MNKEEISKLYDVTTHKNGKCRLNMGKDTHMRCINMLESGKGHIVDIGCGGGHLLELLSQHTTATLYGLDISEKLCELTKERVPQVIVTKGDAENLPYESNSFDAVFMVASLEHTDYVKVLSEVHRVLKPCGVYIVLVPNRDWLQFDFYERTRKKFQPVDDHWFTYKEIAGLLEEHFTIKKYQGTDNLFYYGWKHKVEQFIALFLPFLYKKMKHHIFMCVKTY
jgi:ubiquinone/menaquinone biosynthesis C-methylase UbiE